MAGSLIDEGRRRTVWLVALAVSVALNLALAGFTVLTRGTQAASDDSFDRAAWYSVFLDDKEAFVGHISAITADTVTMDHLYYLTFEARDQSGNTLPNPRPEDFKPTLKKLGQEIWGPEDFVYLSRAKVEYRTRLKADSPIVLAIQKSQRP